jgi:hypothetical protein
MSIHEAKDLVTKREYLWTDTSKQISDIHIELRDEKGLSRSIVGLHPAMVYQSNNQLNKE